MINPKKFNFQIMRKVTKEKPFNRFLLRKQIGQIIADFFAYYGFWD